jgi:hypothetical protein
MSRFARNFGLLLLIAAVGLSLGYGVGALLCALYDRFGPMVALSLIALPAAAFVAAIITWAERR